MSEKIEFFLDGKPVETGKSQLGVRELLRMAGRPDGTDYVVSRDVVEYDDPNQSLDIRPGDKIETVHKPARSKTLVHYKVNGEEQTTETNPMSMETLLRLAGAAASIDVNDLGSYFVENMDGSKYENLTDVITVDEGDEFLAIHAGPTPVA